MSKPAVNRESISETKRAARYTNSRVAERDRSEPVCVEEEESLPSKELKPREQIDAIVSEREAAQNEQRAAAENRAENRTQS